MHYKITDTNKPNPYPEGSEEWHVYIDLTIWQEALNCDVTISQLDWRYDMGRSYYETFLGVLVEDGHVEIRHD